MVEWNEISNGRIGGAVRVREAEGVEMNVPFPSLSHSILSLFYE